MHAPVLVNVDLDLPCGTVVPTFVMSDLTENGLAFVSEEDDGGSSHVLTLRLFATDPNRPAWLIEQCSRCEKKKKDHTAKPWVIELVRTSVAVSSESSVALRIKIHEQCSHLSANPLAHRTNVRFLLRANVSSSDSFSLLFFLLRSRLTFPRVESCRRSFGEKR